MIHTIIEAISATLTAYLAVTLKFSYFLAPNATPATEIDAVPMPIAGSIPKFIILHPAVYTATATGPETMVSMKLTTMVSADSINCSKLAGIPTTKMSLYIVRLLWKYSLPYFR